MTVNPLSTLSLLLTCACFATLTAPVLKAQPRKPAVVFAVFPEAGEGSMDAVVMVDGVRLRRPYNDELETARDTFARKYFAAGKVYRLIFGGGDAGSVKVTKWDLGCNNIHATVTTSTSARLGGKVMALATDSETLGKKGSSRRPPTDAERAAVLTLVKNIYRQRGTPAGLAPSINVTNLTATDLDGDGIHELVGSFTLSAKNKFQRDLFLIAKAQGAVMRADFTKWQAYQPPAEGFLSSIDFIDQLDLDRNGVGEVFAQQGGFDGYALLVFKKVGGRWQQVFDQAGDAC